MLEKTNVEHGFTSTGAKFLQHPAQIAAYLDGTGRTAISMHISPTSCCNLNCPHCSVANRQDSQEIPLPRIQKYVRDLLHRGLKAIILTGGGEPLLYSEINPLMSWLHNETPATQLGLITNGTACDNLEDRWWPLFDWVRVSASPGQVNLDVSLLKADCTVGVSVVLDGSVPSEAVQLLADRLNAQYIRGTRDCRLGGAGLMKFPPDSRFFLQNKVPRQCLAEVCHQSFFRPYLSEHRQGTVFPCDSVVLHDDKFAFQDRYVICEPERIGDYLDGKLPQKVVPRRDCPRCVFADTVEMLALTKRKLNHAHFV